MYSYITGYGGYYLESLVSLGGSFTRAIFHFSLSLLLEVAKPTSDQHLGQK